MKKYIMLSIAIIILSLPISFIYAQNKAETEKLPIGKIIFLKGQCYLKHENGNEYKKLFVDDPVFDSDTVKASDNSQVDIELTDESTISVLENSEITINQSMLEKEKFTNLGILFGTLHLIVKKLSAGSFNINTLLVTAGVRGTEFTVTTRDDGAVLIDVEEGIVEIDHTKGRISLKKGDIEMYTLIGERRKLKGKIDYRKWRYQAIQKIKQNPEFYLNRMFEKEEKIIERLRVAHSKLVEYRKNWLTFLKRVRFFEKKGMYEQEKRLIKQQIKKARMGLLFIIQTRKQLTMVKSIIALSYRIEKNAEINPKKIATLTKIRHEYSKISYIIDKLNETEQTLRRVLYYLNVKYHRLEKRG